MTALFEKSVMLIRMKGRILILFVTVVRKIELEVR